MEHDAALPPASPVISAGRRQTSEFPLHVVEVFWVAIAGGLVAAHAARLASAPGLWEWPMVLVTPLLMLLGLPAADFVSGFIHWAGDTWGSEKTFWLGSRIIRPFRVHHSQPRDLLGSHFFTTNSDSAMANIPIMLAAFLIPLSGWATSMAALFLVSVAVCGLPTSQIHKWSHSARPPRFVRWLQRRGLILRPEHHAGHHAAPHTVNYCITTGWCNGVLGRVGFFPKLEWVIATLTGWKPRGGHVDGEHEQSLTGSLGLGISAGARVP